MRIRYVALLAFVSAVAAQNGTIRVNTRLVEVSVVVRDKGGPVAGLTKEDFTITDGKGENLDLFVVSDSRNQSSVLGPYPGNRVEH